VRKTLFASLWLTISLISFGQFFEEDSMYRSLPRHGEVYLKTGYGHAIRSTSAFKSSALTLGLGLELLPGQWSIGSEVDFSYRHVEQKFFRNLHLPTARLYAAYQVFEREAQRIFAGISLGMLTGIYAEYLVENNQLIYVQELDHQNAVFIGFRGNYKFIQPIGKQRKARINLGVFSEIMLPLFTFNQSNPRGEQAITYSDWLYRLGFHCGLRFGFGG
jgi:hypothetical protein